MLPDCQVISWVHPSTDVSYINLELTWDGGTAEGHDFSTLIGQASMQLLLFLHSHSQLGAPSAAWAMVLTAPLSLLLPSISTAAIIFHAHDAAEKKHAPTSTWEFHVWQP